MTFKRTLLLLLAATLLGGTVAHAQEEKPPVQVSFSVAGETFKGKKPVPMSGTVSPATAPESVKIRVQVLQYGKYVEYDRHFVTSEVTDDEGTTSFSYTHKPLPKGRYRARAEVEETDDHLAGKNPWVKFRSTSSRHR